jgi:predicted nucleic acid-binding protein
VIVADTNLLAYLLVKGQFTREAEAVYQRDPVWAAPLLWKSELRNVLALYVRRDAVKLSEAIAVMEEAERLMEGQEFEVISSRVLQLAAASRCAAYDCEFVALAQDLGVHLVTADRDLVAKFKPTAVSMRTFCA